MSSFIGPHLPPELLKRKRTPDLADTTSDKKQKPEAEAEAGAGAARSPTQVNHDEIDLSSSDADSEPAPSSSNSKKNPTLSRTERSSSPSYGPALPGSSSSSSRPPLIGPQALPPQDDNTPVRDEWMLAPPPPNSTYTERDPTRMRARKFSSKPSSAAKPSSSSSIWTETADEKLARQKDAVLGREAPPSAHGRQEKQHDRVAEFIQASRGKSLLSQHKDKARQQQKHHDDDDDPSKRAFDKEKDMAVGTKIDARARRELIAKSANFGGRFQGGSFL